jgi:hydrogenase nickel incorporation protein HypA/HybF
MHEMAVAENIIKVIEEKIKDLEQKGEVIKVNLKIGKLTCVEPEALKLSFEAISKGTLLDRASLCIESVPITAKCQDCQKDFTLEVLEFCCPFCDSFRIKIKTGEELYLEAFEIE